MKSKLAAIFLVGAFSGLSAVEVLKTDTVPAGCEQIAEIKGGNIFSRYPKEMSEEIVIEEAKKLNAHKVRIKTTVYTHPKLGKQYSSTGLVYKCAK